MNGPDPRGELSTHAWRRWEPVWHAVFSLTLVGGVVGALQGGSGRLPVFAVAVALAASYGWSNIIAPPTTGSAKATGLFVTWGLWLAATWMHVAFVPVGALLAAHVCFLSLRWAVPVAGLFVAGIVGRGLTRGDGLDASIVGPIVIAAVVGIVLVAYVEAIARQSAARADLIDELRSTRAELARAERERGALDERQRVARDVHDTLAQSFTSILTQLQAAQVTDDLERSGHHVEQALGAARDGLNQARRIVWDLDTEVPSLADGLATLAAAALPDLTVVASLDERPPDLPDGTRRELLSIARESLTNVARHARTDRAEVDVRHAHGRVILEVRDAGCGFDVTGTNGGYGLRSIRQRAARVGADVDISAAPDGGTRVRVEVPIS